MGIKEKDLTNYKIKKGNHCSSLTISPFISQIQAFDLWFKFKENCLYSLNYTRDLNKLGGLSLQFNPLLFTPKSKLGFKLVPPHQITSIRLAWRPVKEKTGALKPDWIEIWAYIYDKGKRIQIALKHIKIDQLYYMRIESHNKELIFKTANETLMTKKISFNLANHLHWGYYLYPYFGGNKTSPKEMDIHLAQQIIQ
jgi:hypothetical protein